jgi:type I restriction enzyme S subunit
VNGWKSVRFDECCEVVGGATPSTSVDGYWGGDICWATPKDLSDLEGSLISDTPRKLTRAGLDACAASVLPVGSVLLSSRAPIGHVAVNTVPMATNQGFKSFIPKPDRVNAKFLYWWLCVNRTYLEGLGNGATFKEVSKAIVSAIEIPLPPLDEQRRIAEVLDRAEALRAKRRAALTQLDALTQAIFLDLFGDPVINPKRWPNPTLGGLLTFLQYGPRFYNESYSVDGIRIVRITDLDEEGNLNFSEMPKLTVSDSDREKYVLCAGDLIFARTGATVGKVALIAPDAPPCIAGAYFITMRFAKTVEPVYARAMLVAPSIRAIVAKLSRQAAQQNFSGPGLRKLPMPLPPIELQRDFARRVAGLEKLKMTHRASLAELDSLFTVLQHRAFRGELFDKSGQKASRT